MVNFKELIFKAKAGDEEAVCELIRLYTPLIDKYSYLSGTKDEDLHSELLLAFLKCIQKFKLMACNKENADITEPHQTMGYELDDVANFFC
ncbi:MAG TPA: helix-turn-helix domain-containing protein [Bacillota bacterium]|nr:helix-turn-helix domain-containing protein [Bacillota bacterium]